MKEKIYASQDWVLENVKGGGGSGSDITTPQDWTDEQKAQARKNIGAVGYDWHETNPGNTYTSYIANYNDSSIITDWDNITSIVSPSWNTTTALSGATSCADGLLNSYDKAINKALYASNLANEINALVDAGYITLPWTFVYAGNQDKLKQSDLLYCTIRYYDSSKMWMLMDLTCSKYVVVKEGVVTSDGTLTYPDDTLSKANRPADAKAVGDKLTEIQNSISSLPSNSSAVLYTEQELTDEQRAIARANISKYDWRDIVSANTKYSIADYSPFAPLKLNTSLAQYAFDIDAALACTGVVSTAFSPLHAIAYMATSLIEQSLHNPANIPVRMKNIVKEYENLKAQNIIGEAVYLCHKDTDDDIKFGYMITTASSPYTHAVVLYESKYGYTGTIKFNSETEEYDASTFANYSLGDSTLSMQGYSADAKAVGDALALKANAAHDHNDIYYTETEVDEQISQALSQCATQDWVKENTVKSWNEASVPYIEDGVEILPECSPEYSTDENAFGLGVALDLVVGETYTVTWNGVDYKSVAMDASIIDPEAAGIIILGDVYTLTNGEIGTAPTGEPFFIMSVASASMVMITPTDGSTTLTIAIKQEGTVYHQLDGKLLPDGLPYIENTRKIIYKGKFTNVASSPIEQANITTFVVDKTYIVTWNGTEYTCVGQRVLGTELAMIGNANIAEFGVDTGEPFLLAGAEGKFLIYFNDGSTNINVTVAEPGETIIHKMDVRFLPDEIINDDTEVTLEGLGVTATATELNVLDGITATTDELNYIDGVTSNVQTQLDSKLTAEDPNATGTLSLNRTPDSTVGRYSVAIGYRTIASEESSHAEGNQTEASGMESHAEGHYSKASSKNYMPTVVVNPINGYCAHAEGFSSVARGGVSHAEGNGTKAAGHYSHSEGRGTIAGSESQHVQGNFNIEDSSKEYAHIVGNGESDTARSNAHTLDWDGNAWFAGDVYVGSTSGTNKDEGSKKLATEEYVLENADTSGAASSAVSAHNTKTDAHNDIRLLITALTNRLDALANSDDDTLDQMAEVVAYIKDNRELIEQVTTGKVSVSDIIDNLTTNVANKPLSAAQGVALKALIDAIKVPTKVSELTNDKNYLTSIPSEYVTESELSTSVNSALAEAKASGDFNGADGQRGTGLLPVTTAPSSYTTAVGGITPKYRMAISTIKTQSGATEVLLGDTIRYSYYHYPIAYLDSSYAYCTTRTSIRGATGAAYTLTDEDKATIVNEVTSSLTTETWTFTLKDGTTVTKKVVLG